MEQADGQAREIAELRDRLSRLSQASLRINESLDFDTVLQGVLDSACSLTGARYGVITLLDESGRIQDFVTYQQGARPQSGMQPLQGMKGSRLPGNRWHGPFGTEREAIDCALSTGRPDAKGCWFCLRGMGSLR